MQTLYIIGGPMGVGKTTISRELASVLPNSICLDGDLCWTYRPHLSDEDKQKVIQMMCKRINELLDSKEYENVVYCWVLSDQNVIDTIVQGVNITKRNIKLYSLISDEEDLKKKLYYDIKFGIRQVDVVERSISLLPNYNKLKTKHIDVSGKSVDEVVDEILKKQRA